MSNAKISGLVFTRERVEELEKDVKDIKDNIIDFYLLSDDKVKNVYTLSYDEYMEQDNRL